MFSRGNTEAIEKVQKYKFLTFVLFHYYDLLNFINPNVTKFFDFESRLCFFYRSYVVINTNNIQSRYEIF